ncbi:putative selenate reductase subunit YgfK [Candidatus Bipolaricaulota bacterium]|nr:putative selenate reductase subunit YgfK [Candidatus Bipolaricaulota bacterium]
MSDLMKPQPFEKLLDWALSEFEARDSIFGVPRRLFAAPRSDAPYASEMFGERLAVPIGPAAGPHTQMAQNIVAAWLCGGRFIELKTVQVLDELEIPRPCIDMEDEGYNVEWSQELRLEEAGEEYVKAWVLIHLLSRMLATEDLAPTRSMPGLDGAPGTIFNMSVGYNLEGIQSASVQGFLRRIRDASDEISDLRMIAAKRFSQIADVEIPGRISNSVTLSTMHGCPPDEIERIGRFLLEEMGLHTIIKLNPTLLGADEVRRILGDVLGFDDILIPDSVFEHDLKYERALQLIRGLTDVSAAQGLEFGVKLSNTLALSNHRGVLPGEEMYMSGRALYPITIHLFRRLVSDIGKDLRVSYSAGADAWNVADLLACGALPVTVASDLLRPGGYGRLRQYIETIEESLNNGSVGSLAEWAGNRSAALESAASAALREPRYRKRYAEGELPKTDNPLGLFDCIAAPCAARCPVAQDVPEYAWWIAHGQPEKALRTILSRNPLPGITGYVCTHRCEQRCTRNNYEQSVSIRALKRYAVDHATVDIKPIRKTDHTVAVIGSGPIGLSAAFHLAFNGVQVTVHEAGEYLGGMPAIAPEFRLPEAIVAADVDRIRKLGVVFRTNSRQTTAPERLLEQGNDAVVVGCGFPGDARLGIEGEDAAGVWSALSLLARARGDGFDPDANSGRGLGSSVLVIGGGNTAMDAARTARRLTGRPVTLVYRRTRDEMPADEEEIVDLLAEGNEIVDQASVQRILVAEGHVSGLECLRTELGEVDASGRRRPVPVAGSEFLIEADTIIVAIGQRADAPFLAQSVVTMDRRGAVVIDDTSGETSASGVFAGGDAVRGPATIVEACADGRRAAKTICERLGVPFELPERPVFEPTAEELAEIKLVRARRDHRRLPAVLDAARREGFDLVEQSFTSSVAAEEAGRCLQCSSLCDKCVEVCPNRANLAIEVEPVTWSVPRIGWRDGCWRVIDEEAFAIRQQRQIIHVDDLCNECGNCATFCVHQGRPFADKPRLFLNSEAFAAEADNAFRVVDCTIERRLDGETIRVDFGGAEVLCHWGGLVVRLSSAMKVIDIGRGTCATDMVADRVFLLTPVAEMVVLGRGILGTAGYLIGNKGGSVG